MKKILPILTMLFLSGCTASVTYYHPTGPGKLYGHCNTPLHRLRYLVSDGVFFSMKAYPINEKHGIQISGFFEVADGYVARLTSSEFEIVSLSGSGSVIAELKEFTSRYAERDKKGKVISVEDRVVNSNDPLIGDTHRDRGFWGSIHGDYYQRFDYSIFVDGFSEKSFIVNTHDIIINGERFPISSIEFNLVNKTILLSPCP